MGPGTRDARAAVQGYGGPFAVVAPAPDGAIGARDRRQVAGLNRAGEGAAGPRPKRWYPGLSRRSRRG